MSRRPDLGRAGAGVLIVLAVAALVQAVRLSDVTPVHVPHPSATAGQPAVTAASPAPREEAVELVPAGRQSVRVPILEYHYIRINPDPRSQLGFNLSVTPSDFTQQMSWLAANGYHPIDFDDLRHYLLGGGTLPSRPVVLTFDDGYRDMYTTALPILLSHGFKAVSYVVSGFLNAPPYITDEMMLEMDADGIEIGAHTVSHADLTKVSPANLHREVYDSKSELEALLGHAVLDFCYPSGKFNDNVIHVVQAAGFQTATTELPGTTHSAGDRFQWTRVRVNGGEKLPEFIANLGQPEPTVTLRAAAAPSPTPATGPHHLPVTFPLRAPGSPAPAAPIEGLLP